MTDALVGLGLSNLLLSAAVGLLAYVVHRRARYPALAHVLWVLTLIAAITPPVLMLSMPVVPRTPVLATGASATSASVVDGGLAAVSWIGANLPALLLATWIIGSLVVFAASTQRIIRFGILLRRSCRPAAPALQHMAAVVAYELDMRTVPSVHISAARLAPMTWWSGGRVRVVLPEALRTEVGEAQLRWILAHELAHIKRRDHLVRWLEWLASVAFWWNPVVWWARRNLRRDEEDACDALVLRHLQGQPRAYARTLLTVVEVMAARGTAPALATGLDAARSLEHRFTRIVSPGRNAQAPRVVAAGFVTVAALLMTVGVGVGEATAPSAGTTAPPAATMEGPASAPLAAPLPVGPLVGDPPDEVLPPAPDIVRPEVESFDTAATTLQVSADIAEDGTFIGTAGSDTVTGTDADESFKGYAGADTIGGGPGRDTIDGGDGRDTIRGGDGADTLNGGHGRDTIGGGAGRDTINGGAGNDVIQGGAGRDTISAGPGDDIVRVWADGSPDVVDCGGGDDRAVIGSTDTATRCETVIVRDPR